MTVDLKEKWEPRLHRSLNFFKQLTVAWKGEGGSTFALKALLCQAVEEGATVIAKCWTGIGLVAESVLSVVILKLRTTRLSANSRQKENGGLVY